MPIQTSFNAGEFSPLMGGDVDFKKRAYSVSRLENLIALKQGPAVTRGPTVYVEPVKDNAKRSYLRGFEFSDFSSYVLEFGDQYIRFYKNYARIAYELATPYLQADLFDANGIFKIQFTQSADVLYLTHPDYAPRSLVRISDTSWTLTTLTLDDGPYLELNATATTIVFSAGTGSVTVTMSGTTGVNNNTGFQATDVGRLIRVKDGSNNWTSLRITARASTTSLTATVLGAAIASFATPTVNWRLGIYSDTTGYPVATGFFQDRLCFAGTESYPDRYDLSKTAGYSDTLVSFQPTNAAGTVADDNAFGGYVPSGQVNNIQWVNSDLRGFVIATNKEEFLLRASSLGEAITPSNAKVDVLSSEGSARIQPVRTTSGLTFVQEARRRVFDLTYSLQQDTLTPIDLTLASEHITRGRIIGCCYQKEPVNVIWYYTQTGGLIALTHYPAQEVYAWHRHTIGGVSDVDDNEAIVESVCSIPSQSGEKNDLWLIVRRYINGATVRYVEYMKPNFDDEMEVSDYGMCDSQKTYSGAATATVTGLTYLEGETVKVMVDGKSHPDRTVASGSITLANARTGEKIIVGLPFSWRLVTRVPELKFKDGDSAQGKTMRITNVVVRLLNTLGLKYGKLDSAIYEYDFNQGTAMDESTPLYTGDTNRLVWPDGSSSEPQIELKGDSVFPACIVAIMYDLKAQK